MRNDAFSVMLKTWSALLVIYVVLYFLMNNYIKYATQDALMANGHSYLQVQRVVLSYDALFSANAQGLVHAIMDGREIQLNLHVIGNPIWSRDTVISVATPMGWTRFVLGKR